MKTIRPYLLGPQTPFGLAVIAVTALLDQALKLWLLFGYDLAGRGPVRVLPFMDLVLTWNTGISYGLFQQSEPFGRGVLLAVTLLALAFLWAWLARARDRFAALALGLIVGGALGNAVDRLAYGAVADFVLLHATVDTWRLDWYVFNLADAAIVAGVAGLLYDSLIRERAAKAP
jgi:signal peptidase II